MSKSYAWHPLAFLPILNGSVCTETDDAWLRHRRLELYHRSMDHIIPDINELCSKDIHLCFADNKVRSLVQTAAGDTRRKALSNLWHARVYWVRTVRKGRLVDSVEQALQGSNSCRGSSILEGTGSADRRIEKPTVTVKNISS